MKEVIPFGPIDVHTCIKYIPLIWYIYTYIIYSSTITDLKTLAQPTCRSSFLRTDIKCKMFHENY